MRVGSVGTVQILLPLPNKKAGPIGVGFLVWNQAMFEPARKQGQAEAPRCDASRNRRRDQLTREAGKAILPPLPIRERRPLWTAFSFGRSTFLVPGRLIGVTYFAKSVACRLHIG